MYFEEVYPLFTPLSPLPHFPTTIKCSFKDPLSPCSAAFMSMCVEQYTNMGSPSAATSLKEMHSPPEANNCQFIIT